MNKGIIFGVVVLITFTFIYSYFMFNSDFGVPDTVEYSSNPLCELKWIDQGEGIFQIRNCAIYKLKVGES